MLGPRLCGSSLRCWALMSLGFVCFSASSNSRSEIVTKMEEDAQVRRGIDKPEAVPFPLPINRLSSNQTVAPHDQLPCSWSPTLLPKGFWPQASPEKKRKPRLGKRSNDPELNRDSIN